MSSVSPASSQAAELRRDLPEPLHQQLAAHLRARILDGHWPTGTKLAAEPDLAREFSVSRGTLRRAVRSLIAEGMLLQVHGRGTFVRSVAIEQPIAQQMTSLAQALTASGIRFTTAVQELELVEPSERIARMLELPATTPTYRLRRLRSTDQGPLAWLVNYLRADLVPALEEHNLERRPLYEVLESDYGLALAAARRTFEATGAGGAVAHALEVAVGHPLMYLEQVTWVTSGTPVECSDVWIRGDRLRLTSMLSR